MENINRVDDSTLEIVQPTPAPIQYTKEEIIRNASECRQAIEIAQLNGQFWFDLEIKAEKLGLKTQEELEATTEVVEQL